MPPILNVWTPDDDLSAG